MGVSVYLQMYPLMVLSLCGSIYLKDKVCQGTSTMLSLVLYIVILQILELGVYDIV